MSVSDHYAAQILAAYRAPGRDTIIALAHRLTLDRSSSDHPRQCCSSRIRVARRTLPTGLAGAWHLWRVDRRKAHSNAIAAAERVSVSDGSDGAGKRAGGPRGLVAELVPWPSCLAGGSGRLPENGIALRRKKQNGAVRLTRTILRLA